MKTQEKTQSQERKNNPWIVAIAIIAGLLMLSTLIAGCTSLLVNDTYDTGNVALIKVAGEISYSGQTSPLQTTSSSAQHVIDQLTDAQENDDIEAIVLKINSGGGAPVASAHIMETVANIDKPTVAWISELGASGAYWVATGADHIIAHDLSMVGSIGVIGSYLEFSGFLEEHNITYNRQVAGQYKDMGTPLKEMTTAEQYKMRQLLDRMHTYFISSVAQQRNLSEEHISSMATGELFLGMQAKEKNLVDQLGGETQVKTYLRNRLNTSIEFRTYTQKTSMFALLQSLSSSMGEQIGTSLGKTVFEDKSQAQFSH